MGVNLSDIVDGRTIEIDDLAGQVIAVDALNWIYQFLTIIRQPDGQPLADSSGRVTSHLSGLFYRTAKLMQAGIKPVYVFDGVPSELKSAALGKRRDVRAEALREWKEALKKEDYEEARRQASRSTTVNEEMLNDSRRLLAAMGVPTIQAPSEGEALCSLMTARGDARAAATQDYDALLFGCPRVVRNLSITGKRRRGSGVVTINPEMLVLDDVLTSLGITQSQLILVGMLVGTDFNPGGIPGFGPKKALQAVREKKTLKSVFSNLPWSFDASPDEIYEFFHRPIETSYHIDFRPLDASAVRQVLCAEHDFSEERIDNTLQKLSESKKLEQNSLRKWF